MTVLNHTSDGLYSMVAVLYRALARLGPVPSDSLVKLCSAGIDHGSSGAPRAENALRRWLELGLFCETPAGVDIAARHKPKQVTDDVDLTESLRRACLDVIFEPANVTELWSTAGSADLVRGLAWWMSQDAWTAPSAVKEWLSLEARQVRRADLRVVNNDVRMARLREWAVFLGFAWGGKDRLVLDPTCAVGRALPAVLPEAGREISFAEFLQRLATRLPVLDGGVYRLEVEGRLSEGAWSKAPDFWVSSTLARALRGLHQAGRIQLTPKPDAGDAMRIPSRDGSNAKPWLVVSHVAIMGEPQ